MNILVCISRTPDTAAKINFTSDNKAFAEDGVSFIMNPYDEWYALVRGLELKEANGGNLTVINVGSAKNDVIIRKALAIGADDAVRIDKEPTDSFDAAYQVSQYVKDKGFDIIMTGKETIDFNGAEFGSTLAELLDLPFASYVNKMDYADGVYTIRREIEGGSESLEINGAFVLSAAKDLAEQRIPNMRGIMMSKRKPLAVVEAVASDSRLEVVQFTKPVAKAGVKMIDPENMDELVRLLHEEAKVI